MRHMKASLVTPALICSLVPTVMAHETERSGPTDLTELAKAWTFAPGIVIPLALAAIVYVMGMVRLRNASPASIRKKDSLYFGCGWVALVVALVSPIHAWGSMLFSVHMTQHELLMLVAAPLLVLGRPLTTFLWALPKHTRKTLGAWSKRRGWESIWSIVSHPAGAWLIHAVVLWAWHAPTLFNATVTNDFVHSLQHTSFLFSALLFWWAVIHGRRRALGFGFAVLYMFTTALQSGLLGALLTFAKSVWYPVYDQSRTMVWGLTPIEDQQLGGLVMWIPAALVYIFAGLAFFAGWLRESERRQIDIQFKHLTTN
jgi:putative membrane protein